MRNYEIQVKEEKGVPVFSIKGYFNDEAGVELNTLADDLLKKGRIQIIVDFGNCDLVNSPGVAGILEFTLKVVDDFQGKLVFSGVNPLLMEVFDLGCILPKVRTAVNMNEALSTIETV